MKKITLTIICCISLNAFSQKALTPVAKNGKLRVENGVVVNKHGVSPQLRGISFSWSIWQGQKYYNPAVMDWLSTDFKVSIVRLAMAVQPNNGYLQQPAIQQQLMVNAINEAIKNGIYVLIDWHDHNSNLHTEQAKQFFAAMAKKYHGVPNVIYEIWNEPERVSWGVVKSYALEIIPEIRKYDADNLIIVGSPHWDQDVDIAANDPVTGFNNIAYSFHFYASEPYHQAALRARADKAIKVGLPLFITEWGVGEANGNGKFLKPENEVWLKWMEDNKLSWTNWNITDKAETTAILMPGAPVNGNWSNEQLTPAGVYIREKLREFNK
jgi:endoglucanase